jgi:dihydrofolate reductase
MPWGLHAHQQHLDDLTYGGVVIVGRKTHEALILEERVVRDRINLILTEQDDFVYLEDRHIIGVFSIHDALERARRFLPEGRPQEIFVIGGQETFELFLPLASTLRLTLVTGDVPQCSKFFPVYTKDFSYVTQHGLAGRDHGLEYSFTTWKRKE